MSEDSNFNVRLSKAAREFNVGMSTIIEFLAKKGFKIDTSPNTKLSGDMYSLLVKEYQGEREVKKNADLLKNLSYKGKSVTVESNSDDSSYDDDEPEHDEVTIRTNLIHNDEQVSRQSQQKMETPKETLKNETSAQENITVVEKKNIDIQETKKTEIKVEETKAEVIVDTPAEKKIEVKEEAKVEAKEESKPEVKKPYNETITEKEVKKEENTIISENIESTKTIVKETTDEHTKQSDNKDVTSSERKSDIQFTVVGKIDLPDKKKKKKKDNGHVKDNLSNSNDNKKSDIERQNNRPVQDNKPRNNEQPKKELPNQQVQPIQNAQPAQSSQPEVEVKPEEQTKPANFIPTKFKKLEGPKIVDKIELPVERKPKSKQPIASSGDVKFSKDKKKKRKRIANDPAASSNDTNQNQGQNQGNRPQGQGGNRPQGQGGNRQQGQNQGGNRPQGQGGNRPQGQGQNQGGNRPQGQGGNRPQGQGANRPQGQGQNQGGNRPQGQGQSQGQGQGQSQGQGGNRQNTNRRPKNDRFNKNTKPVIEEKTELSDEEIQKQIKETLARLSPLGKSKTSKHRREKRHNIANELEEERLHEQEDKKVLKVTEFVTANELATMMEIPVTKVISTCMSLGVFVSINQRLDAEILTLVAEEFGFQVEFISIDVQEALAESDEPDKPEDLVSRAPVVTVMGHVDHGKTKLLDYIRHTNVVAGEAGGITQHIGAYEVMTESGKKITFLDTPGHEAFTAMRARGAKITDVAIIVIAADDNVMPQTVEAINHAHAANVPIVFAINKVDKPTANPQKIYEELANMNILVEEWGGKYQSQEISAKQGLNVDKLLEKVLLEAEMLDLKGNPNRTAKGAVIESALDKGRGYVAKILVEDGTLKIGDVVIAGATYGKVKAMFNERNQALKEAGPSTPVLLLGLNGAPQAGDNFNVMEDEREVKTLVTRRQQLQREQGLRTQKHITLDEIGRRIAIGDFKELNIIIKADVDGSVEALSDSLLKLSTNEVQVNVIHKSVGAISESDIMLASASNAVIVGFNVRPTASAKKIAEREEIDIRLYSIIYQAIEEIKSAIEGMLAPVIEEVITCNIEIREVFNISKVGRIAGCIVLDGKVNRQTKIRIIRDGIVIYTGSLGSLKRFKDDVKEVSAGYECGLNVDGYNDIKVGDIIEGYTEKEVSRKLS